MSDGFTVDPDELARHAREVDGFAAQVAGAAGGARPLGREAYGLVGQPFATAAARTAETCSAGVASLALLVQGFGDRLRSVADSYRAADEAVAATFAGIR